MLVHTVLLRDNIDLCIHYAHYHVNNIENGNIGVVTKLSLDLHLLSCEYQFLLDLHLQSCEYQFLPTLVLLTPSRRSVFLYVCLLATQLRSTPWGAQ